MYGKPWSEWISGLKERHGLTEGQKDHLVHALEEDGFDVNEGRLGHADIYVRHPHRDDPTFGESPLPVGWISRNDAQGTYSFGFFNIGRRFAVDYLTQLSRHYQMAMPEVAAVPV